MIINNKSIGGIFLYTEESSQLEFEKNDFVVSGDCIYICTAEHPTNLTYNTVSGIDPKDDITNLNYKPYPGDRVLTVDDFFEQIKKSESSIEDKYISSQALVGILKKYQFGMGMTGIIEDYISFDEDNKASTSIEGLTVGERPLDDLLFSKDLNNGVVFVSPNISQIVDGENSNNKKFSVYFGILEATIEVDETDKNLDYNFILRQYTYITDRSDPNKTYKTRVQELTSPLSGITIYRQIDWINDDFPANNYDSSPDWKNAYVYKTGLLDRINALSSFYKNVVQNYNSKLTSLQNSFRFKKIYDGEASMVSNLIPGETYSISVIIKNNGKSISESMTLRIPETPSQENTLGTDYSEGKHVYFTNEESYLLLKNDGSSYSISTPDNNIVITNVYGRESYG